MKEHQIRTNKSNTAELSTYQQICFTKCALQFIFVLVAIIHTNTHTYTKLFYLVFKNSKGTLVHFECWTINITHIHPEFVDGYYDCGFHHIKILESFSIFRFLLLKKWKWFQKIQKDVNNRLKTTKCANELWSQKPSSSKSLKKIKSSIV